MDGTLAQRYEILDELGQGGMSVVYRARDTTLDRIVAVKVLHEHLANKEENRSRFRREAQAIARLHHGNIVDVYDYSDEEDDQSFIVMEYIPGQNLRDFVDEHGAPPPEVAAMVAVVLADALAHAHDHGVIHRDLKPENVMVADGGRLALMDFGIAHVVDAETMTQTGSLLGSPAHMAPEIIDGQDVNRRSDIFSLGTVLYWLACGAFPFEGDNAPHLLRQVLEVNYRDPEQAEPRLSRDLSVVIERCLSREPDDRFESVETLREALREPLDVLDDDIDVAEELRKYFQNPADYTEEFEACIVDSLVERGRRAMEDGDVPTAIARFNRVLAYDPDNEVVADELEELNRRESSSLQHYAIGAAVLVAVTGVVAYVVFDEFSGSGRQVQSARTSVGRAVASARAASERGAAEWLGRHHADSIVARTWHNMATDRASGAAASVIARSESISAESRLRETSPAEDSTPPDDRLAMTDGTANSPSDVPGERIESPGAAEPVSSDQGSSAPRQEVEESFEYRFKILPLAATVYIDGRRYSVPQVLNGISLEQGVHHVEVTSPGCHTYSEEFRVDGPRADRMEIVLEWKDANIEVLSNRSAVVYLNGDRSRPHRIGADGEGATLEIPFGKADSDRRTSRRRLTLEIRPRDDMQLVRRHTVTLRPGEQTSVNVNFPVDR